MGSGLIVQLLLGAILGFTKEHFDFRLSSNNVIL